MTTINQWVESSDIRWPHGAPPDTLGHPRIIPSQHLARTVSISSDRYRRFLLAFGPGDVAARGVEGNDVEVLGRLAMIIARLEQDLVAGLDARSAMVRWLDTAVDATSSALALTMRGNATGLRPC
ncbi:MAG: hypothetical protein R2706_13595 [Acidimicrobiales bacterium]